jgi:hypothetical protein
VVTVLGCVDDHEEGVAEVSAAATELGMGVHKVNIGRVTHRRALQPVPPLLLHNTMRPYCDDM